MIQFIKLVQHIIFFALVLNLLKDLSALSFNKFRTSAHIKNNNKLAKNGSIVFIVLIFMITLSAIIYSSLRINSYCISIAREREQYEVAYQLIRSLETVIL